MTNETRFIINHKTIFIKLNSPKFKKREFKILFYKKLTKYYYPDQGIDYFKKIDIINNQ